MDEFIKVLQNTTQTSMEHIKKQERRMRRTALERRNTEITRVESFIRNQNITKVRMVLKCEATTTTNEEVIKLNRLK